MRNEFIVKLAQIPLSDRVYVDECGIDRPLVREYARALRGVIVEGTKRGKRGQRVNVVAAQVGDEIVATLCYTENATGESFIKWFKTSLIKSVRKGVTVIMDNASFHPKKKLRDLARRHGIKVLFLPPYSPDYNPIEKNGLI